MWCGMVHRATCLIVSVRVWSRDSLRQWATIVKKAQLSTNHELWTEGWPCSVFPCNWNMSAHWPKHVIVWWTLRCTASWLSAPSKHPNWRVIPEGYGTKLPRIGLSTFLVGDFWRIMWPPPSPAIYASWWRGCIYLDVVKRLIRRQSHTPISTWTLWTAIERAWPNLSPEIFPSLVKLTQRRFPAFTSLS